jgi:hypothetical protein
MFFIVLYLENWRYKRIVFLFFLFGCFCQKSNRRALVDLKSLASIGIGALWIMICAKNDSYLFSGASLKIGLGILDLVFVRFYCKSILTVFWSLLFDVVGIMASQVWIYMALAGLRSSFGKNHLIWRQFVFVDLKLSVVYVLFGILKMLVFGLLKKWKDDGFELVEMNEVRLKPFLPID